MTEGLTSEIYLTKKYISKNEWLEFIKTISNYNGYFRKWQLIITNNNNEIHYYTKTKCTLPPTINNLNSFLLKESTNISRPKAKYILLSQPKLEDNVIDIINNSEIKNKGTLLYLELTLQKIKNNIIKSGLSFYLEKKGIITKYIVPITIPINILSIDFEGNKRYFYKGVPKYLEINKILHLLESNNTNAILNIDTFPYLQGNYYLKQNAFDFDKHSLIIGSSGTGKSKFISLFINNIYKNDLLKQNYKFVIIDPHAALENDIGGLAKVIDFQSKNESINLFSNNSTDIISETELLLDLFKTLLKEQYNSKIERILRHSLHLLLTNKTFNFNTLRKIILDLEYRNQLIKELQNILPTSVIDFFLSDFNELKTKSYGEAISPIIGFIDEMEMLPVFNDTTINTDLNNCIQDNFITLFSLNRINLGDKITKTLSGLIMQQLLTIIQKRTIDEHIIFIIDEVAVVENPILCRYLSESRKYNLSLILAGQYFNQISNDLKNAILANVVNYFIFRVSKLDATLLVDNFKVKIPLSNIPEEKINLLSELNNRECIARIARNGIILPAFKATTLDYKSIPRTKVYKIPKTDNTPPSKTNNNQFTLNTNINLKDILKTTSSSRKVVN